jgi:very-short-patch-repair endonuclease
MLNEAQVQRLVTTRAIEAVLERTPTLKGSSVIRQLLQADDDSGYTRSEAERRMRRLAAAAGLDEPLVNARVLGYEVDFLWPEQRLVVEVDGYQFHGHRQSFESDRRRDQLLVAAGYRVVRVTWIQLRDEPIAVIASIAQALAPATQNTA